MLKSLFLAIFISLLILGPSEGSQAAQSSDSLSARQQSIIPIAAFTANGDTERLKKALEEGLDQGLSINDIKEILIQMYAYAGFPRSLTGHSVFMTVLQEREKRGIKDDIGKGTENQALNPDKLALGGKIQTELVGRPVSGPIYEFSPTMDTFLKEHLFYDIFSRGILNNQERELATVAALAALPAPVQLASHLDVCLNTGLSPAQLRDYVRILSEKVGQKEASLASGLLENNLQKQKEK